MVMFAAVPIKKMVRLKYGSWWTKAKSRIQFSNLYGRDAYYTKDWLAKEMNSLERNQLAKGKISFAAITWM